MGDAELFAERGFGRRAGAGERPALVVVDLVNGFTDPASPLWCDADAAVAATARLLVAARTAGAPVAFTTVEYDEAGARVAAAFLAKVPRCKRSRRGRGGRSSTSGSRHAGASRCSPSSSPRRSSARRWRRCSPPTARTPSSSAGRRPRAACARRWSTRSSTAIASLVPREAVADRARGPHDAALFDIDAKYGDVVTVDDALALLDGRGATMS